MADQTLTIDRRFNGPPGSGNGGYTAGLLAEAYGRTGPVTVSLRVPPPLDRPLSLAYDADTVALVDGSTVVATAGPGHLERPAAPFVSVPVAREAEQRYRGHRHHPFPTCFVCGTERHESDGLRLASGPVSDAESDRHSTACTWTPEASVTDARGLAAGAVVWASLDCPGGWSSDIDARPMVLGRVTAEHSGSVRRGQTYVVSGRMDHVDGRKTFSSTALYDEAGTLLGRAEHVWIQVDPAMFGGRAPGDA